MGVDPSRTLFDQLMDYHTAQTFGGVLNDRSSKRDRRSRSSQRHGNKLRRDGKTGAINQILAGGITPKHGRRWTDIEDGSRF